MLVSVPLMLVAAQKAAKSGHPTMRPAVDDAPFFNKMFKG